MFDTLAFANYLIEHNIERSQAEALAEGTAKFVLPETVTSDRLDKALAEQTNRMIFAMIAVAGLTLTIAKLIGMH